MIHPGLMRDGSYPLVVCHLEGLEYRQNTSQKSLSRN